MPYTKKYAMRNESFEMLRSERRSFFCPNKLWEEMINQCEGIQSVSEYVKIAIVEKMKRDNEIKMNHLGKIIKKNGTRGF